MLTNMFNNVRFLSPPNLSNQMMAKSNGGPKMATKVDRISEKTSSVFFSDLSIAMKFNLNEELKNTKSMLTCKELAQK